MGMELIAPLNSWQFKVKFKVNHIKNLDWEGHSSGNQAERDSLVLHLPLSHLHSIPMLKHQGGKSHYKMKG